MREHDYVYFQVDSISSYQFHGVGQSMYRNVSTTVTRNERKLLFATINNERLLFIGNGGLKYFNEMNGNVLEKCYLQARIFWKRDGQIEKP